jgi:AraC-like DNA-binding protein/mannose-6-phosphate isomerase-like protein (cupin superfamily)
VNIKDLTKNDQPRWNDYVSKRLSHFPIFIHNNEWFQGTYYHCQPGLEIHLIKEGRGTMVVGNKILLQSPGQAVIIRGSVPHQLISKSAYKRTVICLDLEHEFFKHLSSHLDMSWIPEESCCNISLTQAQLCKLDELCHSLSDELETKSVGWERMAVSHVLQITVLLQRGMEAKEKAKPQPNGSFEKNRDLIQQCCDYICSHLGENLTLKCVAKKFSVSEEYLTRNFTKEIGISFYQFVLLQRVAEGKRLLKDSPDLSVAQIALSLGFPSSSSFNRTFKALTGETPSAYRQRTLES